MSRAEFTKTKVFSNLSCEINQICQPLKKIGITYFTYLKNFDDGFQINLSNSGPWLEHYYKFKLYKHSLFEFSPTHYQSGFFLWPAEHNSKAIEDGRKYFDSDNGITIIKNSQQYCEFYFFSGPVKDKWLINFYINNFDFLENFIKFFKNQSIKLLQLAEKNKILITRHYQNLISQDISIIKSSFEKNIDYFEKTLFNDDSTLITNSVSCLTRRESDIAICLINGKTAKETAKELFISPRTVEEYIRNIKVKFKCKNKFQLANKLATLSSYDF